MKVHCEYGTILEAVRKKSDEFRTAQPSPSILPEAGAFYKKKRQIQAAGCFARLKRKPRRRGQVDGNGPIQNHVVGCNAAVHGNQADPGGLGLGVFSSFFTRIRELVWIFIGVGLVKIGNKKIMK